MRRMPVIFSAIAGLRFPAAVFKSESIFCSRERIPFPSASLSFLFGVVMVVDSIFEAIRGCVLPGSFWSYCFSAILLLPGLGNSWHPYYMHHRESPACQRWVLRLFLNCGG